jgi:hypothetical protein
VRRLTDGKFMSIAMEPLLVRYRAFQIAGRNAVRPTSDSRRQKPLAANNSARTSPPALSPQGCLWKLITTATEFTVRSIALAIATHAPLNPK